MKRRLFGYFALYLILFSLFSCGQEKFEAKSDNRFLMGTICIITLYNDESQDVFEGAFNVIVEEDKLMSLQKDNSDLDRLNEMAGLGAVPVSTHTYNVVESALNYAEMSNGAFDPTIAPLVELWGIGSDYTGNLPELDLIEAKRDLTDYRKVSLINQNSIELKDPGMKIDLGGIAKGYIADRVKEYLLSQGVKRAIINLGGNIVVMGSKPENTPWKIGVQNPFDSRGNHIGIASVIDKTVVTSGIYERFFDYQGKRYHHILDPETGFPVENELASVSIISDISIDADALSTTLFVLGLEDGMKLIEEVKDSEAIFVTKDKKVIVSSGVNTMFELHHGEYKEVSLGDYLSTLKQ